MPSEISPCATWESAISPEGSFADAAHGGELLDFTSETLVEAIVNEMRLPGLHINDRQVRFGIESAQSENEVCLVVNALINRKNNYEKSKIKHRTAFQSILVAKMQRDVTPAGPPSYSAARISLDLTLTDKYNWYFKDG